MHGWSDAFKAKLIAAYRGNAPLPICTASSVTDPPPCECGGAIERWPEDEPAGAIVLRCSGCYGRATFPT